MFASLATLAALAIAAPGAGAADRLEAALRRFEEQDRASPPREGGVVFVGGTTIWRWDTFEAFREFGAVNRGVEAAELSDCVRHVDRLVLRHKPRVVVLYGGDDEIAGGKTPAQVADDFDAFVAAVRESLPGTRILYVSIKPSVARWGLADRLRDANRRIEAACEKVGGCEFVDVWPTLLGDDGTPDPRVFETRGPGKGVSLDDSGYNAWTNVLRPRLREIYAEP